MAKSGIGVYLEDSDSDSDNGENKGTQVTLLLD